MADLIITDDNWQQFCKRDDIRCGTLSRDWLKVPYGSIPGVPPGAIDLIPMEEFPDRIADAERTKSTLKDIWSDSPIGILNQQSISYCHSFSLVWIAMLSRACQGLPDVELSASSVGGPITGWTNSGAYIDRALQHAVKYGIASTEFVPMLTTRKLDAQFGWQADAAKHKVTEFADIVPRDNHAIASLLLGCQPVGVGLNWWRHAVSYVWIKDLDKTKRPTDWARYGFEFGNSYGTGYGNKGFGILTGSRMTPDAAYVVREIVV